MHIASAGASPLSNAIPSCNVQWGRLLLVMHVLDQCVSSKIVGATSEALLKLVTKAFKICALATKSVRSTAVLRTFAHRKMLCVCS